MYYVMYFMPIYNSTECDCKWCSLINGDNASAILLFWLWWWWWCKWLPRSVTPKSIPKWFASSDNDSPGYEENLIEKKKMLL